MYTELRYWPWLSTPILALLALLWQPWLAIVFAALFIVGLNDVRQSHRSVLRNYPLTGHLRFMLEYIRPEIRQYFIEDDEAEYPFSRNQRALVYARAKGQNDKRGFGTLKNMYAHDAEWLLHSNRPRHVDPQIHRVLNRADFIRIEPRRPARNRLRSH